MVYLEKRNANLALGEKQMASRSFRVFGTRTDLESVFYEFQKLNLVKYYKCKKNYEKICFYNYQWIYDIKKCL